MSQRLRYLVVFLLLRLMMIFAFFSTLITMRFADFVITYRFSVNCQPLFRSNRAHVSKLFVFVPLSFSFRVHAYVKHQFSWLD